jgi:hypothetical protein
VVQAVAHEPHETNLPTKHDGTVPQPILDAVRVGRRIILWQIPRLVCEHRTQTKANIPSESDSEQDHKIK